MSKSRSRSATLLLAGAVAAALPSGLRADDVSAPVTLQWFDGSYKTIERRTPDYFMAGYGGLWTPPPGRADSGDGSVGYDVYDRFDLGSAGKSTQYGTATGLSTMISELHKGSGKAYLDLIWNHNGFSDWQNVDGQGHSFLNAGGYPGFVMGTGTGGNFGDFHNPAAGGDENMQLAGLIDIDQTLNNNYIRNPVGPNPQNLPAGTQSAYGRLANVPDPNNVRFYPDQSTNVLTVNDPELGQTNVPIYNFNAANPNNGTPVVENATGYLMRNARWLIQTTGADGFRLDATKNMPDWVLKFFDHAVYKAIQTPLLDGSQQQTWSFGEMFDSNWGALQSRIRLDVQNQPANTVGGNRDTLDFALYYAMQANFTSNGLQNNWNNVVNASVDGNYVMGVASADGYANNGSQGVAFVQSHDASGAPPYLQNVAYAYTLMRPGNAIVYFNGNEFGNRGNGFPQQGKVDALGGFYGSTITKLLDIRNSYGRGNYDPRWIDQNTLVFERTKSIVAGYSNRLDNGYDQRTVQTGFASGMHLVELTGNATDITVDPNNNILDTVVVNGSGQITINIPRNKNVNGVEHGRGYVIYGPATPKGTFSVSNVARTIAPDTANASNNGTARLTAIDVVKTNSFDIKLATTPVTLSDGFRDLDADGDNALLKVDGGLNVNGNAQVDYRNPGPDAVHGTYDVAYGFEEFVTKHSPLFGGAGDGEYIQTIDATQLSEGYHYLTARAFRHRSDGGPAVFTDFRKVVYVDRFRPSFTSAIVAASNGSPNARDVLVTSTDKTATGVTVLYNSGGGLTLDQTANAGEGAQQLSGTYDRDVFRYGVTGLKNGNNVFTVITYEASYDPTQNYTGGGVSIQRIVGVNITSATGPGTGLGVGDTDFDNTIDLDDPGAFAAALNSNGTTFNPAGDLNADGLNDEADNVMMVPWLTYKGGNLGTIATATDLRLSRAIALDGTLSIPGGTVHVSDGSNAGAGVDVAGVPLTFINSFNIPANRTITKTGTQTLNINGPQSPGVNAVLAIAQGIANINTNGGANLSVNVSGTGSQANFSATQNIKALSVGAGASASIAGTGTNFQYGGRVLKTTSLTVTGGKLDLNNDNMIVDWTGASVLGNLQTLLLAGCNGGGWNGSTGIASTNAAATGGLTALGAVEASEILGITGTQTASWAGQNVDSSAVLVKYTYGGDANLDGKLNILDYAQIDQGIQTQLTGWSNGDFNYDSTVNILDYVIIDGNIPIQNGTIASTAGLSSGGVSAGESLVAVPEPGALSLLAATSTMLLRRRRKGTR